MYVATCYESHYVNVLSCVAIQYLLVGIMIQRIEQQTED